MYRVRIIIDRPVPVPRVNRNEPEKYVTEVSVAVNANSLAEALEKAERLTLTERVWLQDKEEAARAARKPVVLPEEEDEDEDEDDQHDGAFR